MAIGSRYKQWQHHNWPEPDRSTWLKVTKPEDDFDEAGRAAAWTPRSRENVEMAYGRFLETLTRHNLCITVKSVGERLDLNCIKLLYDELSTEVAPSTRWGILQALSRAFSAMAPETDRSNLHLILTRIKARTKLTKDFDNGLLSPNELIDVAIEMMDEADAKRLGKKAAVLYRNSAIIMGAAVCPLRRQNWASVAIGKTLRLNNGRAWLEFEPGALKSSKRPFMAELPFWYVARLQRYIDVYRPILLSDSSPSVSALWLTWDGTPLEPDAIYAAVKYALMKRRGKPFSFHNFRHAAASFIENRVPQQALLAAGILHHANFRTTNKHYIRGLRTSSITTYQTAVRQIIRTEQKQRDRMPKRRLRRN